MNAYRAHSDRGGRKDPLRDHLCKVAERAAEYASAFGASDEARLTGLLHDLGKYGDLFQKRLRGEARHIDHWSAGTYAAITKGKALAAALAIQGHHVGLQQADKHLLNEVLLWVRETPREKHDNIALSHDDTNSLFSRFEQELPSIQPVSQGIYPRWDSTAAAMLDVRMLFSALVDADFVETERHFEGKYREEGPPLEPERALAALTRYVESLCRTASKDVLSVRDGLRRASFDAAAKPPGLFTLTAPTGSGKTLAMLAFALRHAHEHELRRVVVVIPYLSIIEQTAKVYRDVFGDWPDLDRYIVEHHSLAGVRTDDRKATGDEQGSDKEPPPIARLLAENWDAPIIVTTSVQMLESLFANRPGPCRKLHRLAKSVILFDEVQTLPLNLALPSLATLSHLATARYGATVVFSTATQPAFRELDEQVRKFAPSGWNPREIVPPSVDLFAHVKKRTKAVWPKRGEKVTWDELAERVLGAEGRRALCIVNLRPHARTVYSALKERGVEGLFHLSTYMCPAHRQKVLETVKARLRGEEPCILVSTQCVEAGVDLDFPAVFRAFGPLDAIAQAAGRCNRNGNARDEGIVTVFVPDVEGNLYPDGAYKQGASVAKMLVNERFGDLELDINDPSVYERYYRSLYALHKLEEEGKGLADAIRTQNFVDVAGKYHLIPDDSVNVVVPYDGEAYDALKQEAEKTGLTANWIRKARPHAVGVFRSRRETIPFLDPVPIRPGSHEKSDEWFIYLNAQDYCPDLGLVLPDTRCLMA